MNTLEIIQHQLAQQLQQDYPQYQIQTTKNSGWEKILGSYPSPSPNQHAPQIKIIHPTRDPSYAFLITLTTNTIQTHSWWHGFNKPQDIHYSDPNFLQAIHTHIKEWEQHQNPHASDTK